LPSRRTHNIITKKLLGKTFDQIHAYKDQPAKTLGKAHRIVRHDHATNVMLGLKNRSVQAYVAGELHDLTDQAVSKAKTNLAKTTGIPREIIDKLLNL